MRDGHSSGTPVARRLKQPTRTAGSGHDPEATLSRKPRAVPIRSCSRWGLPCRRRCRRRGALLPHHFTLATANNCTAAVCFLWHCPYVRTRRMLSGTVCPRSPDFPLRQPFGFAGAAVRPTDTSRDGDIAPARQVSGANSLKKDQGMTRNITLRARAAIVLARPRPARSSCNVLRVDGSAMPSTRSWRK